MSGFHNLNNEEVIFIYFLNKSFLAKYEDIFNIGGVEDIISINDNTIINTFKPLDESDMMELVESSHYKYCKSVDEKLTPIVELIRESIPELYDKVKESFKNPNL